MTGADEADGASALALPFADAPTAAGREKQVYRGLGTLPSRCTRTACALYALYPSHSYACLNDTLVIGAPQRAKLERSTQLPSFARSKRDPPHLRLSILPERMPGKSSRTMITLKHGVRVGRKHARQAVTDPKMRGRVVRLVSGEAQNREATLGTDF